MFHSLIKPVDFMFCYRCWPFTLISIMICRTVFGGFAVDDSPPPSTHPPIQPADSQAVSMNPPAMTWRHDDRAVAYDLELSRSPDFSRDVVRVEEIELPLYNHSAILEPGEWHWRYFAIDRRGTRSRPSEVRRFTVTEAATPMPVPPMAELLASLPDHPRIFTTPETLDDFRERRDGVGRIAWENVRARADSLMDLDPEMPATAPVPDELPEHRRQVFLVRDGALYQPENYEINHLNRDAHRAGLLSFAYLISGDPAYAEAARKWADFVADFRVDHHLGSVEARGQHDSVVYAYENGLKELAVTYDRIRDYLSEEQRERILRHVAFHGEAAYHWIREEMRIHLQYQASHGQQCMHALLTTSLAVAGDLPAADEWLAYMAPQYVNRIAWMSDDGGYFEGHYYAFKFRMILEGLAAIRSATGIDIFQMPPIRNAGEFWLYGMSLNYWHHHWGDVFSLLSPYGSSADGYISNLLASMGGNPRLQWWADTVFADPSHIPLEYLAATDLKPRPPVDVAQARTFPEAGFIAAYDKLYDHSSPRLFFRSSQWGAHSHAHADQNSFVLHAGGEILAADVGYYSYYGDENHSNWAITSHAHNTILVNGKGQGTTIDYPGAITGFFHSPKYTFFSGDARRAYDPPLRRFDRSILYIRPDLFVVYDELGAAEASEFTWMLNGFSEPVIDEGERTIVMPQRQMRLSVRHVAPDSLAYQIFNDRQYPLLTRHWTRYTEAFPEPWYVRVTPEEKHENERFLAVMHTYEEEAGERVSDVRGIESANTIGASFAIGDGRETVLFRKSGGSPNEPIDGGRISSDGRMAGALRRAGQVERAVLAQGRRLAVDGGAILESSALLDVSVDFTVESARGQVVARTEEASTIRLRVGDRPESVWLAPPERPGEAERAELSWADGVLEAAMPKGEWVWWIDPAFEPRSSPAPMALVLRDNRGEERKPMEARIAENGDVVAFLELDPRESGIYRLNASNPRASILVQDRWDPEVSRRGTETVFATLRQATEVFVRYPGGEEPPILEATLESSFSGKIVNLLRNGGFEEGIPGYPPRGWTIRGTTRSGFPFGAAGEQGWPGWSTEMAAEGKASLKFVRPLNRVVNHRDPYPVVARDSMVLNGQPMRLRTAGIYHLRFLARGDATHARVLVSDGQGRRSVVQIEPSKDWREYTLETDTAAGSCQISIEFTEGGADDQVVWVDAMEFGRLNE